MTAIPIDLPLDLFEEDGAPGVHPTTAVTQFRQRHARHVERERFAREMRVGTEVARQVPLDVLQLAIDAQFNARLQLAPVDPNAIATEVDGIRAQFDPASARRAEGLRIEWVDDARGKGLFIENPNAPPKVRAMSPDVAARRVAAGELLLVDVRPAGERELAPAPVAYRTLDGNGLAELEALPKDTAIAFLCHHGNRSAQAGEHFRQLGFRDVHNVVGGIEAWADVDPDVARY